jgi:hypothetical protein
MNEMNLNMKLGILFAISMLVGACSDSPEKLVGDVSGNLENLAEAINELAKGDLSPSEGGQIIKKLVEEAKSFPDREGKLEKEYGAEYFERTAEGREGVAAHFDRLKVAIGNLKESGRSTDEIKEALKSYPWESIWVRYSVDKLIDSM